MYRSNVQEKDEKIIIPHDFNHAIPKIQLTSVAKRFAATCTKGVDLEEYTCFITA